MHKADTAVAGVCRPARLLPTCTLHNTCQSSKPQYINKDPKQEITKSIPHKGGESGSPCFTPRVLANGIPALPPSFVCTGAYQYVDMMILNTVSARPSTFCCIYLLQSSCSSQAPFTAGHVPLWSGYMGHIYGRYNMARYPDCCTNCCLCYGFHPACASAAFCLSCSSSAATHCASGFY